MSAAPSSQPERDFVNRDALRGITVGISVSDSADLSRLGLTAKHCELAVAELSRAVFLAGGSIVYGGRLVPSGFTDILIDELRRYRDERDALLLCIPESEHRRLTDSELIRREQELPASVELVCLDSAGEPIDISTRSDPESPIDPSVALTAMRRYVTGRCDARVIVGGKLRGVQGRMPGVVEEAVLSLDAGQPLYVAGGFGGAAAAVARVLGRDDADWYPSGFPDGIDDQEVALEELRASAEALSPPWDGLSDVDRRQLAATHRPGDIASLVVAGLGHFATARRK